MRRGYDSGPDNQTHKYEVPLLYTTVTLTVLGALDLRRANASVKSRQRVAETHLAENAWISARPMLEVEGPTAVIVKRSEVVVMGAARLKVVATPPLLRLDSVATPPSLNVTVDPLIQSLVLGRSKL